MKTMTFYNRLNFVKSITKFLLVAGLVSVMGYSLHAGTAYTWTGATDNNFYNSGNWSAGWVNNYSQWDDIQSDNANVTQTGGQINSGIDVSGTGLAANAPVLNITGKVATNAGWIGIGQIYGAGGSEFVAGNGIINQTTGTISSYASSNQMGISVASFNHYGAALSSGTYNFGGTSAATAPAFIQTSGTANINGIQIGGGGNGVMNMTGYGTIQVGGAWWSLCIGEDRLWSTGHAGTGVLNITGGNLSIQTSNMYIGGTNSTLHDTIDSTGISTIYSSGTGGGTNYGVYITSGAHFNLTLGTGFSATVGQVFKIIDSACPFSGAGYFSGLPEGGTISDSGYTFTASYLGTSIVFGGEAFALTVTAVPEPQAWVMMFSGFATLMGGRRMRRK